MKQRVSIESPPQERGSCIIYHEYYNCSHYASDRDLQFRHLRRTMHNDKQLMPAEKLSVPTPSFCCKRAILGAEDDEDKPYHLSSHCQTRN